MADTVSALDGHYSIAATADASVVLEEIRDFAIVQIAAWPETLLKVGRNITAHVEADGAPLPGQAITGRSAAILRIEPLKYWVITQGASLPCCGKRSIAR